MVLNDGLKTLGSNRDTYSSVFQGCEIEEITLPKTLELVGNTTFSNCDSLKAVYVEENCKADFSKVELPASARIGPPPATMAGSVRVWDLR